MRMRIPFATATLLLFLSSAPASGAPLTFLGWPESTFTIDVTSQVLGSGQGSGGVFGTVDADLTGGHLTVVSSTIDVDDITTTGTGALGVVHLEDLHAFLTSTAPATDSGGGVYDLAGWELTFDHGLVTLPGLGGVTAFDFSAMPLSLGLTAALSTLSPQEHMWRIPLGATVTLSTLANTVTVTVSGLLVLGHASPPIPEPATLVLVAAGLASLAWKARPTG